ncbi:DUF2345 domain-containing protein, partial [Hydromonas duriensis]
GKRLAASVAKGISFFTQGGGIKLFAAKGAVEIQAQSDEMHIIAEKVMKLISTKSKIEIVAKDEILMTAGGSYIRINSSGIEEGTPGNWKAWAGEHDTPGPKSLFYEREKKDLARRFAMLDLTGKGFKDSKIKVYDTIKHEVVWEQKFDSQGFTPVYHGEGLGLGDYQALAGYDGWSGLFEDFDEESRKGKEGDFHPGEHSPNETI